MATAEQAQALLAEAKCLECKIPIGMAPWAVLAAAMDKANGDPVPDDPDALLAEASCLECVVPAGMVPYALAYTIGQIP